MASYVLYFRTTQEAQEIIAESARNRKSSLPGITLRATEKWKQFSDEEKAVCISLCLVWQCSSLIFRVIIRHVRRNLENASLGAYIFEWSFRPSCIYLSCLSSTVKLGLAFVRVVSITVHSYSKLYVFFSNCSNVSRTNRNTGKGSPPRFQVPSSRDPLRQP